MQLFSAEDFEPFALDSFSDAGCEVVTILIFFILSINKSLKRFQLCNACSIPYGWCVGRILSVSWRKPESELAFFRFEGTSDVLYNLWVLRKPCLLRVKNFTLNFFHFDLTGIESRPNSVPILFLFRLHNFSFPVHYLTC